MTLRTWSLLAILGIFAIILTAHAAHSDSLWDDMGPSVSEQMATRTVKAKVLSIEARGSSLVYKISTDDNDASTLRPCPGLASESVNGVFQPAMQSHQVVDLKITNSPFNSCLVTARVPTGA